MWSNFYFIVMDSNLRLMLISIAYTNIFHQCNENSNLKSIPSTFKANGTNQTSRGWFFDWLKKWKTLFSLDLLGSSKWSMTQKTQWCIWTLVIAVAVNRRQVVNFPLYDSGILQCQLLAGKSSSKIFAKNPIKWNDIA